MRPDSVAGQGREGLAPDSFLFRGSQQTPNSPQTDPNQQPPRPSRVNTHGPTPHRAAADRPPLAALGAPPHAWETQNQPDSRHRGPPHPPGSRWRIPSRHPLGIPPPTPRRPDVGDAVPRHLIHPSPRLRSFTDTTIMHDNAGARLTGLEVEPHVFSRRIPNPSQTHPASIREPSSPIVDMWVSCMGPPRLLGTAWKMGHGFGTCWSHSLSLTCPLQLRSGPVQ